MRSATQITVTTFGTIMGLAGLEHGLGEILQGNATPPGIMFPSWPNSPFFSTMRGEPAMSIISNFFVTGSLACLVSLVYLVWAARFVENKHAGQMLILLAISMLLVGGGIFPPVIGIFIGALATQIDPRSSVEHSQVADGQRSLLSKVWGLSFVGCVSSWLLLFPGTNILGYFFGVDDPNLMVGLLIFALSSLLLTIAIGLIHDRLYTTRSSHASLTT
jgi:hypothetical protein